MSRRNRIAEGPLRGWGLPRSADGDPIDELRAVLEPILGHQIDREEAAEMAGNVIAVESVLQRWKARRLDALAAACADPKDAEGLTPPVKQRAAPTARKE